MTREEAVAALERCKREPFEDEEVRHIHADALLCKFLRAQGYHDVVNAYQAIPRQWIA